MDQYTISAAPDPREREGGGEYTLVLLTTEELEHGEPVPGLEQILCHTPSPRGARMCKAEPRQGCLCGTVVTPRHARDGASIAFGFLLAPGWVVLCDDTGAVRSAVRRLRRENPQREGGMGGFFYELLELLIAKDLHHLQGLEDRLTQLEEQILSGGAAEFHPRMTALRREIAGWIRYYTQLDDMVCELLENENGYFTENELRLFRMAEKRIGRLNSEAQTLREYGLQLQELLQAEIDVRQNRIMKTLTIVTTIFLPLSLVAGWYGMNFVHMPELTWAYGYPAVIAASVLIVSLCLWIMKKKKFW